MSNALTLAIRFLRRDWHAGELKLLFVSLLLSVTMVTGLTAFIERLQLVLVGESSQFLAADRVLTSPRPIESQWLLKAEDFKLQRTQYLSFQSMLFATDEPVLVSVKAAANEYPLIGELKAREALEGKVNIYKQGPKAGRVWAENRLLQQLGLHVGDRVFIGDAELVLDKVLVSEPDRGLGFVSLGPRVLMNLDDIAATAIVQEGSRIKYSYLFSGSVDALNNYEKWLFPVMEERHKWLDLENSQPTVSLALQRAKSFFLLSSSIIIVLAAISVAIASTRYSLRHVKHVAVLKTLGVSSREVKKIYCTLLLFLVLGVVILGWALAYILQEAVLLYIAQQLNVDLPLLGFRPFILGLFCAVISVLSFSLPAIYRLKDIPAVRIFQQGSNSEMSFSWPSAVIAVLGLFVLLFLYTSDLMLSVLLLCALALLLAFIMGVALLILRYTQSIMRAGTQSGHWLSLALSNLQRRLPANALLVALFSMSLMLLTVLLGLRDNLFHQWQSQLPKDTPNYFLVNLQPSHIPTAEAWLQQAGAKSDFLYPMVRGRLIKINQQAVREAVSKDAFKRSGADRELNLSWVKQLPMDNRIVEGAWFRSEGKSAIDVSDMPGVSIEAKLAKKLGIKLADKLTFSIAAEILEVKVQSIREVEWDRMRPNFYMLFEKEALRELPATYMTSFYLADHTSTSIATLYKVIPTAVVIEIDAVIKQIRSIIAHVSLALQFVLFFVLLAAVLVMIATVQDSLDARRKENTVIRALGGTKKLLVCALVAEFMLLGGIAGGIAVVGAELTLAVIQYFVMGLPLSLHVDLWWQAPLLAMFLTTTAGYISASQVVRVNPMALLRRS